MRAVPRPRPAGPGNRLRSRRRAGSPRSTRSSSIPASSICRTCSSVARSTTRTPLQLTADEHELRASGRGRDDETGTWKCAACSSTSDVSSRAIRASASPKDAMPPLAAAGRRAVGARHGGERRSGVDDGATVRHRARAVEVRQAEGHRDRQLPRTESVRRSAGRARQEPLRLRAQGHRGGGVGHRSPAARPRFRARRQSADRHRSMGRGRPARWCTTAAWCSSRAHGSPPPAPTEAPAVAEADTLAPPPPLEIVFFSPSDAEIDVTPSAPVRVQFSRGVREAHSPAG